MTNSIIEQVYETILREIQAMLEKDGYKRSGNSPLFYRYHDDRKIACALKMQKSMCNSSENIRFTFNVLCISVDELLALDPEFFDLTLNLSVLKKCLLGYPSERIGHICRGYDAWYELEGKRISEEGALRYFDYVIRPDIEKTMALLNESVSRKIKKE